MPAIRPRDSLRLCVDCTHHKESGCMDCCYLMINRVTGNPINCHTMRFGDEPDNIGDMALAYTPATDVQAPCGVDGKYWEKKTEKQIYDQARAKFGAC